MLYRSGVIEIMTCLEAAVCGVTREHGAQSNRRVNVSYIFNLSSNELFNTVRSGVILNTNIIIACNRGFF